LQAGEDDVSQFDTKFTKQTPIDSPDESTLSESANLVFQVIYVLYYVAVSILALPSPAVELPTRNEMLVFVSSRGCL
jgi:p70 ribosomal S6 kinase